MNANAMCADMDTAAYLRRYLADTNAGRPPRESWPCPRIVFSSGATGNLMVTVTAPTRAVVMVTAHYEPDPAETHPDDVERIRAAVADLNATMPDRYGRALAKVTVTFQRHAQYTLTKADADWTHALIGAVCPVVNRWIGQGGEWCISHEVDPTQLIAETE